jgi:hypothetical protein
MNAVGQGNNLLMLLGEIGVNCSRMFFVAVQRSKNYIGQSPEKCYFEPSRAFVLIHFWTVYRTPSALDPYRAGIAGRGS